MQVLKKGFDTPFHEQIGVTRGGKHTKIHAVVDGLGNPLYVQLSGGQISDITIAPDLLDHIEVPDVVLADKAYGSEEFRKKIEEMGSSYCIPPKTNLQESWDVDWWLYKERSNVERFFQKIKNYRRIATRYDKLAKRFLGFVHLACILIWLK